MALHLHSELAFRFMPSKMRVAMHLFRRGARMASLPRFPLSSSHPSTWGMLCHVGDLVLREFGAMIGIS
jgi:hypothetical protein